MTESFTLTPEVRAELDALRAAEAQAEAERVEASQPWNAPPAKWSGVASTLVLYKRPPPPDNVDPIAGPPPVAPEDHEPVAARAIGPGSLLAVFAASRFAERHATDSARQRLLDFIGSPDGGLGMVIRLPMDPARRAARDELNKDRANVNWSPLAEPTPSCDWGTWCFIVERATRIVRGGDGTLRTASRGRRAQPVRALETNRRRPVADSGLQARPARARRT